MYGYHRPGAGALKEEDGAPGAPLRVVTLKAGEKMEDMLRFWVP